MKDEKKFHTLIGIIAHDIRSSVGYFSDLSQFLTDEYQLEQDVLKHLFHMKSKALDTIDFLTEMCEWAKDKDIEPKLLHFQVNEEVRRVIRGFDLRIKRKNISLVFSGENYEIYSDKKIFSIVARNLISNAVKFTPIGGKISISLEEEGDDKIVFCVKNDISSAIDKSVLDHFFDIERNHEKGTDGERGTGLGLSLVKKFTDMLGWKSGISSDGLILSVWFTMSKKQKKTSIFSRFFKRCFC